MSDVPSPSADPADVSLDGVGVVLLHRGDPPSVEGAAAWLKSWYADPYAFTSSFGTGTQRFFASLSSKLDASDWAKKLNEAGGRSPLVAQATELAELLSKKLAVPVVFGTLYAEPRLGAAVEQLKQQGVRRVVGLSLHPQKCDRFLKPLVRGLELTGADASIIDRFGTAGGYLEALRAAIREGLERAPGATVLFCALPIDAADDRKGDAYLEQLKATTAAAMEPLAAPWKVSWLGKGAPGVDAQTVLEHLKGNGTDAVVLVPIGTAVDELETVHGVDVVLRQAARALGFARVERARSPVGYSTFIDALGLEVRAHLARLKALGF